MELVEMGHTGLTDNNRSVHLLCLYLFEYQDAFQMNTNIRIIRIMDIRMRTLLIYNLKRPYNKRNLQLKIKIVGDGPMFNELKNLNHPKLIVLGKKNKNQILKLMSEATCLLFPSKWYEGMPLVLLEALSVGLPIVASNIGNMKFIIKNNYNGLLFNINDTGKLSKYANNIFNNKKLRLKLETNAKKIYHQRYTDKLNYIKLIKIYKDVIDSKKL